MSGPHDAELGAVLRAFGAAIAHELKRNLVRNGSRFYALTQGSMHQSGRFAWYEAAGPTFRTRRYAITDRVTPLRDELEGFGQLLALHVPLDAVDPIPALLAAFAEDGRWVVGTRTARAQRGAAPRMENGALVLDLVTGDDRRGQLERVTVDLARAAIHRASMGSWDTSQADHDDSTEQHATVTTDARRVDPDATADDANDPTDR